MATRFLAMATDYEGAYDVIVVGAGKWRSLLISKSVGRHSMLMSCVLPRRSLWDPGCSILPGDPPRGEAMYLGSGRCGGGRVELQ